MYKICFFVPQEHAEKVKCAVFSAGAGTLGNYDQCCWETLGTGQFRPLTGSQPFIGQPNKVETVPELKVETICADEYIDAVIAALHHAHPYEEPAFEAWPVERFSV